MTNMKKAKQRGRLVSTKSSGIAYEVEYGFRLAADPPRYGRTSAPVKWTKCTVRVIDARPVPEGSYFLYTSEGKVHQLKLANGVWQYLAAAA
jgi:hypothetical protein